MSWEVRERGELSTAPARKVFWAIGLDVTEAGPCGDCPVFSSGSALA